MVDERFVTVGSVTRSRVNGCSPDRGWGVGMDEMRDTGLHADTTAHLFQLQVT